VNLQQDLFSINNIIVPTKNKIIGNINTSKKQNNLISSNCLVLEQKSFTSIDVVSIDPNKIDSINKISPKNFKKRQTDKIYKKSDKCKNNREAKWHIYLYDKIKTNIKNKNDVIIRTYDKALLNYNLIIASGFPATPPIIKPFYNFPNFTPEFLLKLWDIQGGIDAYADHNMVVSYKLHAFKPSCDRIDSNKGYEIGNVVLCCYSTNTGKNKFDVFSEEENSWMDYITNKDPIKKEKIRERIKKIQKLSME